MLEESGNQLGQDLLDAARDGHEEKIVRCLKGGAIIDHQNLIGCTALHYAASIANTKIVHLLIDNGIDFNLQSKDGNTAFHFAAWNGKTEIFNLQIDGGIDLNIQNKDGNTALHLAALNGNIEIVNLLIKRGINLNIQNKYSYTALNGATTANKTDIARLLIDHGTDLNIQCKDGFTSLHDAARIGNLELVRLFIDTGIDINLQNKAGWSALHYASSKGNREIVHLLINNDGIKINLQNKNGDTAFHRAVWSGETKIVNLLIDGGIDIYLQNKVGSTALHVAASNGNTEIARLLFDNGIAINIQDNVGSTALHIAASNGNTEIAQLLFDNGIDINIQDKNESTALHVATDNGKTDMVHFLVDHRVALELQDKVGSTALHVAASNGNTEIAQLLFDNGIDSNIQDNRGQTALHKAVRSNKTELVNMLTQGGIDLNLQNKDGLTALHCAVYMRETKIVQLLIDNGIDIYLQDNNGFNALHIGTWAENTEIVRLLIANRINLNSLSKCGKTALHIAATPLNEKSEIFKLLIDGGIHLNVQDKDGNTALHKAVKETNITRVMRLLKGHCDTNIRNNDGKRAIELTYNSEIKQWIEDSEQGLTGLPAEVRKLDKKSAQVFSSLLEEETYPHFESRVMLAGEQGVGKTTIARHLVGKRPTKFRISTDGIELYNGLCFMDRETKCWLGGQQDFSLEDIIVSRSLLPDEKLNIKNAQDSRRASQNIQDGTDSSLSSNSSLSSTGVTKLKSESNSPPSSATGKNFNFNGMTLAETSITECASVSFRSDQIFVIEKVAADNRTQEIGKQLLDEKSEQTEITPNVDCRSDADFSLGDIIVSRSLLPEEKLNTNSEQGSTRSSQNIHNGTDSSLLSNSSLSSTGETKLKSKTNSPPSIATGKNLDINGMTLAETSITESASVSFRSDQNFVIEKVAADNLTQEIGKQLLDDKSEQTEITPNIDCRSDAGKKNNYPTSSETSPVRTANKSNMSDCSINENEQTTQVHFTGKENIDSPYKTHIRHVSFDAGISMNIPDDLPLDSDSSSDMYKETITKTGVIRTLKRFFCVSKKVKRVQVSITKRKFFNKTTKVGKKQLHNKKIAPIIIWDFGGQDVFYSTHQTFLTYRAIYIIALDGSRKLDDPSPYKQYLPGKSGQKTARDYLIFWLNTIVTYCKGSIQGFPKIMIVLTHKDKVKANEVEQRRYELFAEISAMFEEKPLMQHLVIDDKIFVNAKNEHDPEMAKIKDVIISESEKQPTWGDRLPKCFIPLEIEFASLIRRSIPLITIEHLKKINSVQPIRPLSETELKVFLKYQHSIGKILYFDEQNLDSHVILSPTHLIDAFKSIVTDRRFVEGDKKREELWEVMGKKGVVSKTVIQTVWKKKYREFYKNKDYLLNVMTHLDILVEPKRYNLNHKRIPADFYYIASMVRAKDDSGYLQSADLTNRSIALVFQSLSLMIPPALSFRFISYCLYVWAVKTCKNTNMDMLFHMSGVFTIAPSVDMYILCEDEMIVIRLVHTNTNTFIMRDLASSINECLTSALEKISQLYISTCSEINHASDASFITSICCNSPTNPCIIKVNEVNELATKRNIWMCPSHDIEHNIHTITSWFPEKDEEICKPDCPVTNEIFLKQQPSDLHLRRLSLLYLRNEIRELALHLGLKSADFDNLLDIDDLEVWKFEVLRKCRDRFAMTFKHIREASEAGEIGNIHILCKVVKGDPIAFDKEPEKWDLVPTEEHIDRLAPLIGNSSLRFLIELEMEFQTWEQINYGHTPEKDLVKLNKSILVEWRTNFCTEHNLKPTLRNIAQAFRNIGKHIDYVETTLSDLF